MRYQARFPIHLSTIYLYYLFTIYLYHLSTIYLDHLYTSFPFPLFTIYLDHLSTIYLDHLYTSFPFPLFTIYLDHLYTSFPFPLFTIYLDHLSNIFLDHLYTSFPFPLSTIYLDHLSTIFPFPLFIIYLDHLSTIFLDPNSSSFLSWSSTSWGLSIVISYARGDMQRSSTILVWQNVFNAIGYSDLRIQVWGVENGILLNAKKSGGLLLGLPNDLKRIDIPRLPPISIDRCVIPYSAYDFKCELSMKLQRVQNACVRYAEQCGKQTSEPFYFEHYMEGDLNRGTRLKVAVLVCSPHCSPTFEFFIILYNEHA
ncbi:hypothetical protein B566_EDAN013990 [Ephemera danica]|nr:hypothetical protein B566_EDAN013990 [Ephemera danica]